MLTIGAEGSATVRIEENGVGITVSPLKAHQYKELDEYEPKLWDVVVEYEGGEEHVIVGVMTTQIRVLSLPDAIADIFFTCDVTFTGRNLLDQSDSKEMTIKEAYEDGVLKEGDEVLIKAKVSNIEPTGYTGVMPIDFYNGDGSYFSPDETMTIKKTTR